MHIKQLPKNERPRERLLQYGARSLSNSELLAILIRCGQAKHSALHLAQQLLTNSHGRIAPLFNLSLQQAQQHPGIGPATYCQLSAALELARRQLGESLQQPRPQLTCANDCKQFLSACLRGYQHEVFACLFLNNQHQVIDYAELFHGSINQTAVYPREIIKQALKHNAAHIILAHNHPSGCATPSQADYQLTQELQQLLNYMQIRLLDHMVVGDPEIYSMAEQGDLLTKAA